jgi:hypothetical protein
MGITKRQKEALISQGIWEITDIPEDFPLKWHQRQQVKAIMDGEAQFDEELIKQELDKLVYPVYFLDYETYNSAIPIFDGFSPQQQIPFQYSLHKISDPNAKLEHFEFLSTVNGDPGPELVNHLIHDLGTTGSVVVWNKSFEMSRNKEMAKRRPDYARFLEGVNARVFDLMDIFYRGYYMHPDFHGSYSIKHVLPVMVPELTYEGLMIGKGDQAMIAWWEMINSPNDSEAKKQITIDALLKYCELDTLAMVEIWRKLEQISSPVFSIL